jgi:hypothetical protein
MKLLDLLNEIIDEAIGDFNLGGIRGSGYTAGRVGMGISNFKNKFGGVSTTKGLGGVYKSSKQAQKALTNLGMSKVTIGTGNKSGDIILSFSIDENATNQIQFLYVTPAAFNNIKTICQVTGNDFKNVGKLYQVKGEKTNTNLLYELKKGNVMYFGGVNNRTGKFYVPISYTNAPTTALTLDDIRFLDKEGYNSADYKVYKFDLTVKP